MSLSSNYVPVKQLGNGATVDFSSTWKILATSYLVVSLEDVATGVQTLKVLGTDYTAVFDENGFTVTFLVAPTSSYYVVIGRDTGKDQTVPYKTSKGFQGEVLETSLDKLTAQMQELQEQVTRAILFPLGSASSGFTFPAPDAGKGLRWNDLETALQNSENNLDDIVDDATAQAVIAAAQAAIATTQAGLAATARAAAEAAETNAETAETNAETAETNAETAETNAAASAVAAAASAAQLQGTSATSLLIAVASKVFTTQAGKIFHGENVRAYSAANAANYMDGLASYSGTTLTLAVASIGGSGTFADWVIKVNGDRGATGATGAAGTIPIVTAGGTVDAITADFTPDISLVDGALVAIISAGANTVSNPTLATDGSAARTIFKSGGVALVAGDIGAAGACHIYKYTLASTRWELLNPCKVTNADMSGSFTSLTLITPVLGTPTSGTLTNCTGLPIVAGTTGTLTETRGGTNQTTYTQGDILYASAANTLSKLPKGAALHGLRMNAGATAPEWSALSSAGSDLQTFTGNGTWTKPAGATASAKTTFRIWDGGASGGSRATTGNGTGGGGGAYGEITVPTSILAGTETIVVAASVAGVSGNSAGNSGNQSSVTINGVTYTISSAVAVGGQHGTVGSVAGGTGGVAKTTLAKGVNGATGSGTDGGGLPNSVAVVAQFEGGAGGGSSSSTAGGTRTGGTALQSTGGTGGAAADGSGTTAGTGAGAGGGGTCRGVTSGAGAAGRVEVFTVL